VKVVKSSSRLLAILEVQARYKQHNNRIRLCDS